jgi:nicotinamidase-related amidase
MPRTLFFDVDTQFDFVLQAGALYVPGAERLVEVVRRLHAFAASREILVISSIDAHPENDGEFTEYAAHCVRGATGMRKPDATLLFPQAVLPETTSFPINLAGVKQLLVEKTTVDCFRNRNLTRLLNSLSPATCFVYGVAAEVAVQHAAMGLLRLGFEVVQISDAIQELNPAIARRARQDFARDGGRFADSTAVLAGLLEPVNGTTVL